MPLKVWNGSSFTEAGYLKVWDGSSWVPAVNAHTWNGSAWIKFFPSVKLSNDNASNFSKAGIGGTAVATYRLASSGQASSTNLSGVLISISGEWLVGSGTVSDYEVKGGWSPQGGGPGGIFGGGIVGGATPDIWLGLGTTRDYTLSKTNGFAERELYLEIRIAASSLVIASATINVSVDSAP